jgi:hypothetical protein
MLRQGSLSLTSHRSSEVSHLVYERASRALASLRQSDPELQRQLRAEVARTLFGEDSNVVAYISPPIPAVRLSDLPPRQELSALLLGLRISHVEQKSTPKPASANPPHSLKPPIQATQLKAKSRSSIRRPSRESPAATNGRARNYSAQNAKRKRLSNSSTSSRKRS